MKNAERHVNDAVVACAASLAHHWRAVGVMREIRRRPVNDAVVTRIASLAHHWRAVRVDRAIRRRPANDAVVSCIWSLAHHWRAVCGFCIVLYHLYIIINLKTLLSSSIIRPFIYIYI